MDLKPFTPDTTTKFTSGEGDTSQVPAETVSQAGGVIVVTQHERNGKDLAPGYGLTHRLTGATLTGKKLGGDIEELKKRARRFWKALTPKQKKIWQTSNSFLAVQGATSREAVNTLR